MSNASSNIISFQENQVKNPPPPPIGGGGGGFPLLDHGLQRHPSSRREREREREREQQQQQKQQQQHSRQQDIACPVDGFNDPIK